MLICFRNLGQAHVKPFAYFVGTVEVVRHVKLLGEHLTAILAP